MYKFLMIEIIKDEEILLTYDMVCQKFNLSKQQIRDGFETIGFSLGYFQEITTYG